MVSMVYAMIETGRWIGDWWLSIGTPILHIGQYAPRERVARKPAKLRRSLITVSGIIEPPHCVHSIVRFPSVPCTKQYHDNGRTQQEQGRPVINGVAECGDAATRSPTTWAGSSPTRVRRAFEHRNARDRRIRGRGRVVGDHCEYRLIVRVPFNPHDIGRPKPRAHDMRQAAACLA